MPLVLALDQGTSSSRAIVFDETARVRGFAQREFPQYYPQAGWVEHDPREIWESQIATARDALGACRAGASGIAAIGITNQRETTLLWERDTGTPVARAIVWQDRRTAQRCDELRAQGGDAVVRDRTGLTLDPYFSATKLSWLLDNVAGARDRAERGELAFGTVDTWLLWNLTGGRVHATDFTNASRTMLFDIRRLEWSEPLLELFGIPRSLLPDVKPCTADFGNTDPALFGAAIPIRGIAGDQHAALAGQGCFAAGLAKNTYGTGAFAMLNTGTQPPRSDRGMLSTIAYAFDKTQVSYALEGSVFVTGAAIQWLRDELHLVETAAEIESLARECTTSGGLYFVPAFTGLGAPYWDPHARGALLGITRATSAAQLARAALEAISLQCAEVIGAMTADASLHLAEVRVDGGGAANGLLLQMQADALGADVVRPQNIETTALGAAFFAGLSGGIWTSTDELASLWREHERFRPKLGRADRERMMTGWRSAVCACRSFRP